MDVSQFDFTPGNVVLVVASQWSARKRRTLLRDIDAAIDAHTAWAIGDHPLFKSRAHGLMKNPKKEVFPALHVWKEYSHDVQTLVSELKAYQVSLLGPKTNGSDSHSAVLYIDLTQMVDLPSELAELIELTSKALRITIVLLADAPHDIAGLTEAQRRNIDTIFYMDAPLYTDEVYRTWFSRHFDSFQIFRTHEVLALQHGFAFTLLG